MSIAIAGAGIGGLAAAALLATAGHRVVVFDQFAAPAPVGSGLMLQETGLSVLGAMGLRDRLTALGSPIQRLYGRTMPRLRTVLDVRFSALHPDLHAIGIQRSALFDALLEAALIAGTDLQTNTEIAAVDAVAGTLEDTRGQRLGPFDLVVDGLGVSSPLSRQPRKSLPYGALWVTLDWPEGTTFDAGALEQRYQAARKMAGVMASGAAKEGAARKATYFWSIRGNGFDAWQSNPLDAWKEEAADLWPETADLIDAIEDHDAFSFARYRHRTHNTPARGRLIHIGDSWHAASPQLGQGANMALLDAYALFLALTTGPLDTASRRYLKSRRGHVRLYQMMSFLFTPVYQSDSAILPILRDRLAAPVSRAPPAPALLAAMVSGAIGRPLKKLELT
ncbi:MAG: NAD(P)/FAD-dependent oxidoreductase [Pseudomonadota bacterium]